jgi:hypothetical protein
MVTFFYKRIENLQSKIQCRIKIKWTSIAVIKRQSINKWKIIKVIIPAYNEEHWTCYSWNQVMSEIIVANNSDWSNSSGSPKKLALLYYQKKQKRIWSCLFKGLDFTNTNQHTRYSVFLTRLPDYPEIQKINCLILNNTAGLLSLAQQSWAAYRWTDWDTPWTNFGNRSATVLMRLFFRI